MEKYKPLVELTKRYATAIEDFNDEEAIDMGIWPHPNRNSKHHLRVMPGLDLVVAKYILRSGVRVISCHAQLINDSPLYKRFEKISHDENSLEKIQSDFLRCVTYALEEISGCRDWINIHYMPITGVWKIEL